MIYRLAQDKDLKEILFFIRNVKKEKGKIINFLIDDDGQKERNRISNPRYFRSLLFDFNSKIIIAEETDSIKAIFILYTPPKISKATVLELIHYYGLNEFCPIEESFLKSCFKGQFSKVKLTLTHESDKLANRLGFKTRETINYLSGKDYVYSVIIGGEAYV